MALLSTVVTRKDQEQARLFNLHYKKAQCVLACLSLQYFIHLPRLSLCIWLSWAMWLCWFLSATQGVSLDRYSAIQGLVIFMAWNGVEGNAILGMCLISADAKLLESTSTNLFIFNCNLWLWKSVSFTFFFNCSFRTSKLLLRMNNQTVLSAAL